MATKNIMVVWRIVFSNWRYLILAIIIALLFYNLNVLIANYANLASFYSSLGLLGTIKFFFILSLGFGALIKTHSFVSLIIVSILFGMLLSLTMYKVKVVKISGTKKTGFFSSIGVFLAAFAPGCAACGIGLASLLGIGGAFLIYLPFEGLELSILAIAILSFTTWKVSKDLSECESCQVQLSKNN
ncbi:MAG: hypothetical protein IIA87_01165 [Nanoarchaeota archaeon]|nr:hypothetical protein [Nanoarchaeota archaeon]